MEILFVLFAFVAMTLLGVVFFGAPYVPTRSQDVEKAIRMAGLKPGELLVDLGCGDGRLLLAAARKGIRAEGYELSPLLVLVSRWRTRRYRKLVKVHLSNYWLAELPSDTNAVFVFLAETYMKRLEKYLTGHAARNKRPLVLISYAFALPGHQAAATDKALLRYDIKP